MPADLWPPLRRGSRRWMAEVNRLSQMAADACDQGNDPSAYLASLEQLTGQRVDPVQFQAKLGTRWGRNLRLGLRRVLRPVVLTLLLIAALPVALLWPLFAGVGCLLGKVPPSYWAEVRRYPWGAVRFILRLMFVPRFRNRLGEQISEILCEEEPSPDAPEH